MGVKAGEGREDSVILTPPPLPLSLFLTVDRPLGTKGAVLILSLYRPGEGPSLMVISDSTNGTLSSNHVI